MVYKFFNKNSSGSNIAGTGQIVNLQMNFINRFLENLKKEKFIHCLETKFAVLI